MEIAFSYPAEVRNRAIDLLKQGLSKNRISKELGVGFTTIRRWTADYDSPYSVHYTQETKEKAVELAKSGISRAEISKNLNVGYYSVLAWTRGINTSYKHLPYPPTLKRKARRMVRSGLSKMETAARLGVSRNTLYDWTADIHAANSRLTGAAEKILTEVVNKGFFFPKPAQLNVCRMLKQELGLKLVRLQYKWILFLPKEKDEAMKAYLKNRNINYLSAQKLINTKKFFHGRNGLRR